MIEHFRLLRHISTFDDVSSGAGLAITPFTFIYAENARGKTTLAAILRSLGKNDPIYVNERARLGASSPPHIVISGSNGEQAVFQNGAWTSRFGDIVVFDDLFVAENVCSGLSVEAGHRQNLHELIIGAQGVALSNQLQTHVYRIEAHNRELQTRGNAIPANVRGGLSIDDFCALEPREDIDAAIQAAERSLAAAKQANAVNERAEFLPLTLPEFDLAAVTRTLEQGLPELEAEAAARVQEHLAMLGDGGESWVADGMPRIDEVSVGGEQPICPFCAQDLAGSPLIAHYQAYFGDAYRALRESISNQIADLERAHSGEIQAAFERSVRVATQSRQFWAQFVEVPEIDLDTAAITRSWLDASNAVIEVLRRKQSAPLDQLALEDNVQEAIDAYNGYRLQVVALSDALAAVNQQIAIVKENAAAADEAALQTDLNRLNAVRARFELETAALCMAYEQEKTDKATTKQQRDAARAALESHRATVFATYETSINDYLTRFHAGFRLSSVNSVNLRSGSTCSYNVLINQVEVPLTSQADGMPSFKNTLSSGDRNALALAFFFASLENDPNRDQKIVVIDDPMTSLDEHRSLTTIQEIRRLADDVGQLIVLSHSKAFLCTLWQSGNQQGRSSIKVARHNPGSTLADWDVNQDCITEHDKRHQLVREYIATGNAADDGAVAVALRPILEVFARVAYPEHFPPGFLLGPFIGICQQKEGTADEIMSPASRTELRNLLDYANQFHHDTNAAYQTVHINDHELEGFARRTLAFTSRN